MLGGVGFTEGWNRAGKGLERNDPKVTGEHPRSPRTLAEGNLPHMSNDGG